MDADANATVPRDGAKLGDAEAAARIAVAVEDGDRALLIETLRSAKASEGVSEDILTQMAAILMEES